MMPDRTPWWPLRWEEVERVKPGGYSTSRRRQFWYGSGATSKEATTTLPNGRRFTVIDRTTADQGYAIFTVDAFGQTDDTPTERVPDLISLRCFLQAEADA